VRVDGYKESYFYFGRGLTDIRNLTFTFAFG
jgi:hypothetical protein